MADHGVHGMDTQALLGFVFFICLRTLRTVSSFIMSYPVSRVSRFARNHVAVAASVSVLFGLQQISQNSSPSLLDVAADSAEDDSLADEDVDVADEDVEVADEDVEATDSARGDEGATDSATGEDESIDALTDEDGDKVNRGATGDDAERDIARPEDKFGDMGLGDSSVTWLW